ncbi:unnamed protein product [Rhodiola kirilowii]
MKTSNTPSIFSTPEHHHHFSDYGFDPQITHFLFTEESSRHRRRSTFKPIDSLRFRLQKPISKPPTSASRSKTKKKQWWKKALGYLKEKWAVKKGQNKTSVGRSADSLISGPVFVTESRSGFVTPYMGCYNASPFGMIKGGGEMNIPYVSLISEMNMGEQQTISTSATPIYLVT